MAGRAATEAVIQGRCAISVNDPGHPTPSGWERVALSEIADLGTGHTPSRQHPEYWDGDIAWIGIRDAGAHHGGVINDTAQHVTELGLANSAARLLPKDTVCLSRTASVGYVVKMGREMATSQDFVTWTCSEALDPDYLKNALLAEGDEIRRFGEGSTHTTIYFPEVKAFHIDLPPVEEQRRIVLKTDSLLSRSLNVCRHLDHAAKLIAQYRKAVLLNAYQGHLTAVWRKSKALPSPVLKTVGELVTELRYGTAQKCHVENVGVAVLRIPNVSSGSIDLAEIKYTNLDAKEHKKLKLLEGDILVIRSNGSPGLVGRAAVVSGDAVGMAYAGYLIRLRPNRTLVLPKFLSLMLEAPQIRRAIEISARSTSGIHNINSNELAALAVPLPSMLEQQEIVRRIEAAYKFIDRLAVETTSARKLIDHLDQAVLSKAFRGELVPQDPNDEPASVLLERVRGDRKVTAQPRRRLGRPKVVAA